MYGGIIFSYNTKMISGIFVYKKHISLEFSLGFLMKDPDGLLEGKGKYRRHLKLYSLDDVTKKKIAYYVEQAVKISETS